MSVATSYEVDSRQYIFAYLIQSEDDVPADFPVRLSGENVKLGLFLPRYAPNRFGRSSHPPRILLLSGDRLVLLTHPRYSQPPLPIPVSNIEFFEAGQMLLIGWLRFVTAQSAIELAYNTRSHHRVREFLRVLMDAYLPKIPDADRADTTVFGPPLDIKFAYCLSEALERNEWVRARLFSPPVEMSRRWGPLRRRSQTSGDLVAFTNRRVVWITDRWNGRYERYGSIIRTAPVYALTAIHCSRTEKDRTLILSFCGGASWTVPLSSERCEDAKRFTAQAHLVELERISLQRRQG
jgi:hypothetical protein